MNHHTTDDFWACYHRLPEAVQRLADGNYQLLKTDPRHPSLHFKRVGRLWSVRVGIGYRALAVDGDDGPCGLGSVHTPSTTASSRTGRGQLEQECL
jgi:hypothetical protein